MERVGILSTNVIVPGGMTGSQPAIEAQRLRPGLEVLPASGYDADPDRDEVTGRGALPVPNKPYRRDERARPLPLALGGEGH